MYTMLELIADSRNGVPMHVHQNEDEHFVVLEGSMRIANGDERFNAPAGTTVTIRKGVPHAWGNVMGVPLRVLGVFSPGQIRDLFRTVAPRQRSDIAAME